MIRSLDAKIFFKLYLDRDRQLDTRLCLQSF